MKLITSIVDRKLPRKGTVLAIALQFHLVDAGAQLSHAAHIARQASSLEHADLDLGYIQPTGMLGDRAKLHAPQNLSSLFWRECLKELRRRMGVELSCTMCTYFG
ncbi:hypothetical protein KSD_42380 [Ktedonobacter sp. SOSP1-85]|nr:hypothetical protein KSD_42380 [Ktedonobacter sp. SOSP1-85]